ncbi:MAG: ABC transporter substrate-binding protein [Thermomicrobiales bacterium]
MRQRPIATLALFVVTMLLVACGGATSTATVVPPQTAATTTHAATTSATTTTAASNATPATSVATTPVVTSGSAAATPSHAASPAGAATPRVTTYPLTIKDDAGRDVTFAHAPMHIISLAPSNTEILYALGLADRVVGVDDNSDYPAEAKAKPKVGGFAGTNLEQVVALQPDLILASGITAPDLLTALTGRNLTVVVLNPPDLPGVLADLSLVGQLADVNAQAAQVRGGLEARIAAVATRLKNATTKPRVFFELDPTQFYTAGPHSFVDDLITRAGGTNIAADASTPYPTLSVEQIIAKDPEVIILSDENQGVTPESVKARAGWSGVSAVKNGRIAALNPDLTNRPGPRVVDALEQLALAIHPELYR